MRLGTILGGKAWSDLNIAASEKRRADKKKRRDEFEFKKRRRELEDVGFKPLNLSTPRWV